MEIIERKKLAVHMELYHMVGLRVLLLKYWSTALLSREKRGIKMGQSIMCRLGTTARLLVFSFDQFLCYVLFGLLFVFVILN